jgi:hypothetical protein
MRVRYKPGQISEFPVGTFVKEIPTGFMNVSSKPFCCLIIAVECCESTPDRLLVLAMGKLSTLFVLDDV